MTESRSHKATANRLAKKYQTDYNQGQGADVQTKKIAIEVETADTVNDASRQLGGHKKPVYIAGTTKEAVQKAIEATEGTTIGVMNNLGKIVKPSSRTK